MIFQAVADFSAFSCLPGVIEMLQLLEASHVEKNGFDRSINAVNRLLWNISISSEILEEIFNYESGSYHYFRNFVRRHPNCPPHLLDS